MADSLSERLLTPETAQASLWDRVKDLGVDALKSAVALPESLVGLADIPTGGRVGKAIEDYTPIQFKETQDILDTLYSAERQQEQADVSRAFQDSFLGGLKEAVTQPAVPIGTVVQSLPIMLAGRGISTNLVEKSLLKSPALAAGLGEGLVTAGSQEEGIRYDTPTRTTSLPQGLLALGSGALTGGIGAISNKVGARLGLDDIDIATKPGKVEAGPIRKIVGGSLMEGVAEELPQSIQEQIATNLATGKKWDEGIAEAGGLGMLSGMATGGVINSAQVAKAHLAKKQAAIKAGDQPITLGKGQPTLDEEKSAREAAGAVTEAQQAESADPITAAASHLKVDPQEFGGWLNKTLSSVKSAKDFTAQLIKQFGQSAKRFALQLYNFGKMKVAEERGSVSGEPAGSLQMQNDNIEKIKAGTKTAISRTYPIKAGLHSLPDGTQINVEKDTRPVWFKDLRDPEAYAKAEGFTSLKEMRENAKFKSTKDFLDGKRPLYIAKFSLEGSGETLQEKITKKLPSVANENAKKWVPKEQAKTRLATQFIGEGKKGSSTENYRSLYEEHGLANTGQYSPEDIIFVASNGNRGGAVQPVVDGKLQGQYKNIDKAIAAGATIIADTRAHLIKTQKYNTGEVALAKYLHEHGYTRDDSSGAGVWSPAQPVQEEAQQSDAETMSIEDYLNLPENQPEPVYNKAEELRQRGNKKKIVVYENGQPVVKAVDKELPNSDLEKKPRKQIVKAPESGLTSFTTVQKAEEVQSGKVKKSGHGRMLTPEERVKKIDAFKEGKQRQALLDQAAGSPELTEEESIQRRKAISKKQMQGLRKGNEEVQESTLFNPEDDWTIEDFTEEDEGKAWGKKSKSVNRGVNTTTDRSFETMDAEQQAARKEALRYRHVRTNGQMTGGGMSQKTVLENNVSAYKKARKELMSRRGFSAVDTGGTSLGQIILDDLDRLFRAGYYIPDVIRHVKKSENIASLGDARNGQMESLDELVSFVRNDRPHLWPKSKRIRIFEPAKTGEKRTPLPKPKPGKPLTPQERQKKTAAAIKSEAKINGLLPVFARDFFHAIDQIVQGGFSNQAKTIHYGKFARWFPMRSPQTAKTYATLSDAEKVDLVRKLFYYANSLHTKSFQSPKYADNPEVGYLGESIEMMRELPGIDQTEIFPLMIDELDDRTGSFTLVNTTGNYLHNVTYFDNRSGQQVSEDALNFTEMEDLRAAQREGLVRNLQVLHRFNLENKKTITVEYTRKSGSTYQQKQPLANFLRTKAQGKVTGKVVAVDGVALKDLQENAPFEFIAAWESTKEISEFLEHLRESHKDIRVGERPIADIKADYLTKILRNRLLTEADQFKKLAEAYQKYGVTEDDLLNTYAESGKSMIAVRAKIAESIDRHNAAVIDKVLATRRSLSADDAIDALTLHLPDDMKKKFRTWRKNPSGQFSGEERRIFEAINLATSRLQESITEPLPQEKPSRIPEIENRKNALKKELKSAQERLKRVKAWESRHGNDIATVKANSGLVPNVEDIVTFEKNLTDFEKDLTEKYKNQNLKVGQLRSRAARTFYSSIAKIFDADLVIVSADNFSSRYVPQVGRSKLIINANQNVKFATLFGHELFHHVLNRVTPAERKAFTKALQDLGSTLYTSPIESREIDDIRDAYQELGVEEIQADVFAEIFTHRKFYDHLATTFAGKSLARKLISRLLFLANKVTDLFSKHTGSIDYAVNSTISLSDIDHVYDLMANLLVQAQRGEEQDLHVKYFGGAITADAKKHLTDSKNWLTGAFRSIFPKGSKSHKEIMTQMEGLMGKGLDFIGDQLRKIGFSVDYRTTPQAKKLANNFLNRGHWEQARVYHQVIAKHANTFKGMSRNQLSKMYDFFARGLYITDPKSLGVLIDTIREDYKKTILTKEQYHEALEKAYKRYTAKVKKDGKPLDLNDPADVKLAKDAGYNDAIINAYKDYRTVSDRIWRSLSKIDPTLKYRPDHFGQSLVWFHNSGEPVDTDIDAVIGKNRWEMLRNDEIPTEAIAALREMKPESLNPNDVLERYVRDAYRVIAARSMIEQAIREDGAKVLPPDDRAAARQGLYAINDKAFDVVRQTDVEHPVGYSLVHVMTNDDGTEEMTMEIQTYTTKFMAEEAMRTYQQASPKTAFRVDEKKMKGNGEVAARVYFSKHLASMINTVIAKDKFKSFSAFGYSGRKLLLLKNLTTTIEFSFSLFHPMTILQELTSSFASHSQVAEKGLKKLQGFNVMKSSRDTDKIFALVMAAMKDESITKDPLYIKEAKSLFGEAGEDVMDVIHHFFVVGGRLDQDETLLTSIGKRHGKTKYKSRESMYEIKNGELVFTPGKYSSKSVKESIKRVWDESLAEEPNKVVKALFKTGFFTTFQTTTDWFMRDVIPKVKMAAWVKEYTLRLEQNAALPQKKQLTKHQIADDVMKFVEDRFGEVNWQQQYMNPSLASSLKFLFRSFTWVTGNWKALSKAGVDWAKLGWFTLKGEGLGSKSPNRYRLTEKGRWGMNAIITHVLTAGLLTAAYSAAAGLQGDEVPDDEEISLTTKLLFPRYDRLDPEARIAVPSYITEFYKILHHIGIMGTESEPSKLVSGRLNSIIGNSMEAFNGEDFRGVTIRDSRDSLFRQSLDSLLHIFSIAPISVSSAYGVYQSKGINPKSILLSAIGATQAPAVAKRSAAANIAFQVRRREFKGREITAEQMALKDEVKRAAYAYGQGDTQPLIKMVQEGKISMTQFKNAVARIPRINGKANPRYLKPLYSAVKHLTLAGSFEVWEQASDSEKKQLRPLLLKKYINAVSRHTLSREKQQEALRKMRELHIMR